MPAHKVAKVADIEEGGCKTVMVDGENIALFNISGKFYAMDDTCKHKGGSLGSGTLDGNVVKCPLHGWTYDVTNGNCEVNPAVKIATYPVKVEGDEIIIEK